MAMMPDIPTSTRRIEVPSSRIHYAPSIMGEVGRDVGGALSHLGRLGMEAMEIKYRADMRDAEYAAHQAADYVKRGWNGYDVQDQAGNAQHVAGVIDRNWRQMDAEKLTAGGEMGRLVREVREQDFYKNLTSDQRKLFERKWNYHVLNFNDAARRQERTLHLAKMNDQITEEIAWNGQQVGETYGRDMATFEKTADWATLRNFSKIYGSSIENPEALENPNATFDDIKWRGGDLSPEERSKKLDEIDRMKAAFYVNRITALQNAGANDQPLGNMTAEQCLAEARATAGKLKAWVSRRKGEDGGDVHPVSEDQYNELMKGIEDAENRMLQTRNRRFDRNYSALNGEIDKEQWKMAEDPSSASFDDAGYLEGLKKRVIGKEISEAQATSLYARYQKLHADRDQLEYDMKNPSQFAAKTDQNVWLEVSQKIANAERDGASAASIEEAVESAKPYLTQKDYFSLWTDARKKRDAEDDRVVSQVFGGFLKIDNETASVLTNPAKRGTKAFEDAFSTASGSWNADYEQSGKWYDPDFTVEDVKAAVDVIRKYVKANPDNPDGASNLLNSLVEPFSAKARAAVFRDRIAQLIKSGQWNVDKAF